MILDIAAIVICLGSVAFNLLVPRQRAVDVVYKVNSVKLKGLRDAIKYDRIEAEKLRSTSIQLANQAQDSMQDAAESLRLAEGWLTVVEELHRRTDALQEQSHVKQEEPEAHRGVAAYFQ